MTPDDLISESKVAAIVTDPRLPDNPIVACNDAFLDLTGYERTEVLGQNCRFLRGELTELERTQMLREAVAERRPALVDLTNYRKDGTPFRNAVMIAPLFDERGELLYFLGSQMEIDESVHRLRDESRLRLAKLSPRQRQILKAVAKGLLNKQIAYELGLTERTVKMHRAAMLNALGLRTAAEAIRVAVEAGF